MSKYYFQKRANVRFILSDGKCYGSGCQKKYNDETSIIQYIYIENVENEEEIKRSIIYRLEKDAKKSGAIRIFSNIEDDELEFYHSLGYLEVDKIDDDRVHEIYGAIVGFDKTVMKNF